MPSLLIESVHDVAVLQKVAGLEESLATGSSGVWPNAIRGAHVDDHA